MQLIKRFGTYAALDLKGLGLSLKNGKRLGLSLKCLKFVWNHRCTISRTFSKLDFPFIFESLIFNKEEEKQEKEKIETLLNNNIFYQQKILENKLDYQRSHDCDSQRTPITTQKPTFQVKCNPNLGTDLFHKNSTCKSIEPSLPCTMAS